MEDTKVIIDLDSLYSDTNALLDNIASVVLGKRDVAKMCLVALLSDEHIFARRRPRRRQNVDGQSTRQER